MDDPDPLGTPADDHAGCHPADDLGAKSFPGFVSLPSEVKSKVAGLLDLRTAASACLASTSLRQAGQDAAWRRICCSSCGHVLLHPRDIAPAGTPLRLQDGDAFCALEAPGVETGREYRSTDHDLRYQVYVRLGVKAASNESFWLHLLSMHCGGCQLYLGCRVLGMQDGEDSDDEGTVGSAWRTPCGALYICYRYVYLARKDGAAAAWGELPPSHNSLARMVASDIRGLPEAFQDLHLCRGKPGGQVCGAPLFRSCDMLLSAHLSLPLSVTADARPSSTILVNSVRPGSIELRWHEPHTLPNGHLRVEVLHAYCQSCGAAVGWRFAEVPGWEQEMADAHNSYRLWGRYGILSAATQRRTP